MEKINIFTIERIKIVLLVIKYYLRETYGRLNQTQLSNIKEKGKKEIDTHLGYVQYKMEKFKWDK